MISKEELIIQIALGVFPEEKITPEEIRKCKDIEILKLIARFWVDLSREETGNISNDTITNALLNHSLVQSVPYLAEYIIAGRIRYRINSQLMKLPPSFLRAPLDKSSFRIQEMKLKELEEKIFK